MFKNLKFLSFLSIFSLVFLVTAESSLAAENESSVEEVTVTLTNDQTGEVIDLTELSSVTESDDVETGYEVYVPLGEYTKLKTFKGTAINSGINPGIMPLASEGGEIDSPYGVLAVVKADYDLRNKNQEIRVNRIYGSWTPSNNLYMLSNRTVNGHSGSIWGSVLPTKYPTSNTFSYTTNWGYNVFGGGDGLPRIWTSVKIGVTGMTGTYTLNLQVAFPQNL